MSNYNPNDIAKAIVTFYSGPRNQALLNAIFSISEFCYAHEQLNLVAYATRRWTSVAHRVYLNACYNYLAAWFAISGGNQLRNILTTLGLAEYLKAAEECIDRRLGNTTYREAVRKYRNKISVHPQVAGGLSQLTILDQSIGLPPDEVARAMQDFLDEMYIHVRDIRSVLEDVLRRRAPAQLGQYFYETGWI